MSNLKLVISLYRTLYTIAVLGVPALSLVAGPQDKGTEQDEKTIRVEGDVVDTLTRVGIEGADVRIAGAVGVRAFDLHVKCSPSGAFVADLPAGLFSVTASASNYTSPRVSNDVVLDLSKGESSRRLHLFLDRMSSIRGVIVDADTNLPVQGMAVVARRSVFRRGHRQLWIENYGNGETQADGTFRLPDLPPAEYFLELNTNLRKNTSGLDGHGLKEVRQYARTYWPGPPDSALPLVLDGHGDLDVGLLRVQRTHLPKITFKTQIANCEGINALLGTLQQTEGATRVERHRFTVACGGSYTLDSVSPGDYEAVISDSANGTPLQAGAVHFTVDHDDDAIDVVIRPPIKVTGTLRIDGNESGFSAGIDLSMIGVRLWPMEQMSDEIATISVFPSVSVMKDGNFTASVFYGQDSYVEVVLSGLPKQFFIKEVVYNGHASAGSVFKMNPDAVAQSVAVNISGKAAMLYGRVCTDSGEPVLIRQL